MSLSKVSGPSVLKNRGDTIVYKYTTKNPNGNTIWSIPHPINGIFFNYANDDTSQLMTIIAKNNLNSPSSISITAHNNGKSDTALISIYNAVYTTIPITTDYFNISGGDTVCGFSDAVIADPTIIPSGCNAIDFTTNSHIKYVSGDCQFSPDVFTFFPIQQLNLSGLKFHFQTDI
ncbi:hypothetical protein FACS1894166_04800 [Bacilli bacterium]|nr:hypothetical protein FACS1894166_04800 [Bacilli bacterium]